MWDIYDDPDRRRPGTPPTAPPMTPAVPANGGDVLGGIGGILGTSGAAGDDGADPWNWTPPQYTGGYGYEVPELNLPDFVAPDSETLLNEPGYQFRLGEGTRALEQSAAARGTLRTGGSLKDLINYGQAAASQEYENAFGRAVQAYRIANEPLFMRWQELVNRNRFGSQQRFDDWWRRQDDEYRREALAAGM